MNSAMMRDNLSQKVKPISTVIIIGLVINLPIRLMVKHLPEAFLNLTRPMVVDVKLAPKVTETGHGLGNIFLARMASWSAVLRMITVL